MRNDRPTRRGLVLNVWPPLIGLGLLTGIIVGGCLPPEGLLESAQFPLAELPVRPISLDEVGDFADGDAPDLAAAAVLPAGATVSGELGYAGDYRLFDAGPAAAGDAWSLSYIGGTCAVMTALFDDQMRLLARTGWLRRRGVTHTLCRDTPRLIVGVATRAVEEGGTFRVAIQRNAGAVPPEPLPQVVWLNFAGARNVSIQARNGISFDSFDAAVLGDEYADATAEIKQRIRVTIEDVYAGYELLVLSSDEEPRPDFPHSVIHFGGRHDELAGLADGVDECNLAADDNAIVFVETFARFAGLRLSPDDMGRMIGNTAAHELGHLLGLYHTYDAAHIMNVQAGSAWDLAAPRLMTVAPLDETVFPVGELDPAVILQTSVGVAAVPAEVE